MTASQLPPAQALEILHESGIGAARRLAAGMARSLGFGSQACEEIALAATELASNLVKHARNGRLSVVPLNQDGRVGLEIESQDAGPGIGNIEEAVRDGFSTAGSLGIGLGSVNRLMDEFDIHSDHSGTRVVCRKWIRLPTQISTAFPLAFGMATRPMRPGEPNGDAAVIKHWAGGALVGIIDGLGHGQFAHRAALAAQTYVESHYELPLADLFRGAARACSATRGAVMALARFDLEGSRLSFASVGNIEARVFQKPESYSFMVRRGIVGINAPSPTVTVHDWDPDHILVLHSDGVQSRWRWKDFESLAKEPAQQMAHQMLRLLAKEKDDATILVVKRKPS